jgi:DNA-binding protein WhiA
VPSLVYNINNKIYGVGLLSFSSLVKEEITRLSDSCRECLVTQMIAVFEINAIPEKKEDDVLKVKISTENPSFMRKIYSDIKELTGYHPHVISKKNSRLKKHRAYTIILETDDILKKLQELTDISIKLENGKLKKVWKGIGSIKKECCLRTYLRYAFLSGGYIADPEKSYHLEFTSHDREAIKVLCELLNKYDLHSKEIERKNDYVCYIKESDNIVDFLNIIGAHKALVDFENVRIVKEMRNNVNRIVNCETANLDKTVNAAVRQIQNINYIKNEKGLDKLPESLKQIAEKRLQYKELSLKELGEILSPQLGKSGVNHRLRKLERIADEIREEKSRI